MSPWEALKDNPVAVALATAFAMWVAGWVRTFLAHRVKVQSPEAEAIRKIVPAVNMLVEMKDPELTMLIALGEAMQGKNNGNVTNALTDTRNTRDAYRKFLGKAAYIEVES